MGLEDEGVSELLALQDFIQATRSENTVSSVVQNDVIETAAIEATVIVNNDDAVQQQAAGTPDENCIVNSNDRRSVGSNATHSNANIYRKDFKIFGQIGEPNQKDKLSFSSLEHQVENGLRKGYTELEIVEAVIR